MAKIFKCEMEQKVSFLLKADTEDAAQDWANTHTASDACALSKKVDAEYNDTVYEADGAEEVEIAIDISTEGKSALLDYDTLLSAFQSYVNNDLGAAEPSYVLEVLQESLSDEEIKALGFGDLLDTEEE